MKRFFSCVNFHNCPFPAIAAKRSGAGNLELFENENRNIGYVLAMMLVFFEIGRQ